MTSQLQIETPMPPRGAMEALRRQVIEYLLRVRPAEGTLLFTDAELARRANVSHSTVRRVLRDLGREGWIERRLGHGSFAGARASLANSATPRAMPRKADQLVRLALLTTRLGNRNTWDARRVLEGLDEIAIDESIAVEILGVSEQDDLAVISRRLIQNRPDVLACLVVPGPLHTFIVGEALRQEIPCIGSGTRALALGLPGVCEDGAQGARLATEHLIEQGHRRIGFVLGQDTAPWVFRRREGYLDALAAAGIDHDENMVVWLAHEASHENRREQLQRFLHNQKPTAVVSAHRHAEQPLVELVRESRQSGQTPLSLVTFGHYHDQRHWEQLDCPTYVDPPMEQIGQQLGRLARQIAAGETPTSPAALPYRLVKGKSTNRLEPKV